MVKLSGVKHRAADVALAVKRLQHRHHRALSQALAPLGLSLVQWDTLRHLDRQPDASLHDLAVLTFQTDQSFGSLAVRMAERGLIERITGPGRAVRHRLTDEGARLAAITSGGAIPDTADYDVIEDPAGAFVGKVNEDFAIESMSGDIFLLGNRSWRILRVEAGRLRVADVDSRQCAVERRRTRARDELDRLHDAV